MTLERWPVSLEIPVAWGDMDAFQHVNNTVYVRWCESARIAYFERAGLLRRMEREGIGPILARIAVDYRRPVVFPDAIRVEATVSRLGNTSFDMRYRMSRASAPDVRVAEGDSVIVLLNYRTGEKVPLDAEMRAAIDAVEGGARP